MAEQYQLETEKNDLFARITAINDYFSTANRQSSKSMVQTKHARLKDIELELKDLKKRIVVFNSQLDDTKKHIPFNSATFDDLIDVIDSKFLQLTSSSLPTHSNLTLSPVKMDLDKFSGSIADWQAWKSMYDSLVHTNTSIPVVQKMQILFSHLHSDALSLISNLQLIEPNYQVAYDILVKRYSNIRRLAHHYVSMILNFKNSDKYESSDFFLSTHTNCIAAIKNLGLENLTDALLFCLCYENLSKRDKCLFDNEADPAVFPTTKTLLDFVEKKVQTKEFQESTVHKSPKVIPQKSQKHKNISLVTQSEKVEPNKVKTKKTFLCPVCDDSKHKIYSCPQYLSLNTDKRLELIKSKNRCKSCLGANHDISNCLSKMVCFTCGARDHHSSLHVQPQNSLLTKNVGPVLLSTVELEIKDSWGLYHKCKAVVDNGSQISAITSFLQKKLDLKHNTKQSTISGFGGNAIPVDKTVECCVRSPNQKCIKLNFTASVVDSICAKHPQYMLSDDVIEDVEKRFHLLPLSDSTYYKPSEINLLLGADLYSLILSQNSPTFIPGYPAGVRSIFGFLLSGGTSAQTDNNPKLSLLLRKPDIEEEMKLFWEVEEISVPKPEDPENIYVDKHFEENFTRTSNGSFQVRLCFKPNYAPLTSNRSIVKSRYFSQEKRLVSKPESKKAYDDFFKEYINLGHMVEATSQAEYLLTHHAIYKEYKSSTKTKAVFHASFSDGTGKNSLNNQLCTGKRLQLDLPQIIDSFRIHNIVVCCDIDKFFRNIQIHPEDRKFLHIFWREDPQEKLSEYEMTVVPYGLKQSPYLALKCLQKLAQISSTDYPQASNSLLKNCYVDDIITGSQNLESAKQLCTELVELLSKGCFKIKKWVSNSNELLSSFPRETHEQLIHFSDHLEGVKILGLVYNPDGDYFAYHIQPYEGDITKRKILSYIFKIYDCNGYLAPVIIKGKRFLQELWLLALDWDDPVPEPHLSTWLRFVEELPLLSSLKIPRKIPSQNEVNILAFSDASSLAMSCSVYIHTMNSSESWRCYLLRSKTKVNPLKTLTIPRAELQAAVMATRLVTSILSSNSFPFKVKGTYYFTDSEIVLAWLKIPPHELSVYVSNRVVQILECSSPSQWNHVKGDQNPADIGSRGVFPSQLLNADLYWKGPPFTHQPVNKWSFQSVIIPENLPEKKPVKLAYLISQEKDNYILDILERHSTLDKAKRICAYVLRFIHNSRGNRIIGCLSAEELQNSIHIFAKLTQEIYFEQEILQVKASKNLKSTLRKLSPFIEEGILRVGGRLKHSSLEEFAKHPILLHSKSRLAYLLCDYYHKRYCHAGLVALLPAIRQRWWIVSLRTLLKKYIRECLPCYRLKAKPVAPMMSDLPSSRVRVSSSFSQVGLDFFGPFQVKESLRKNARCYKAYGCIFICFVTKAVHIEIVTSLTTEAFNATLDRFFSRRGLSRVIHCDNATNFVGASAELKVLQQWLIKEKDSILSSLAAREVKFKFNCPTASSMGGLWESAVKSAKTLFYRLVRETKLTFEEYVTVYTRIESVLNSRPLVYLADVPDDGVDYLSPGHFLIGQPLLNFPEQDLPEDTNLKSRWLRLKQMTQCFWKRWSSQYLHTQIQRVKWTDKQSNIKIGQVVLMSDFKTSPLSWPLGRIEEVFPGQDSNVRVVRVKTMNGSYLRPVNKLVPLPMI